MTRLFCARSLQDARGDRPDPAGSSHKIESGQLFGRGNALRPLALSKCFGLLAARICIVAKCNNDAGATLDTHHGSGAVLSQRARRKTTRRSAAYFGRSRSPYGSLCAGRHGRASATTFASARGVPAGAHRRSARGARSLETLTRARRLSALRVDASLAAFRMVPAMRTATGGAPCE